MANAFLNFFKEPAPRELIKDKFQRDRDYKRYRLQVFCSLYIGYVASYIGRKNFSVVMKSMGTSLSLSNSIIGMMLSAFYITYGIGKFVNGMLADKSNARTFFSAGLVLAAGCLFGFAMCGSLGIASITILAGALCFFWGANGWFQSMTFPPISKSLSYWFVRRERGVYWSVMSTSHQIGALCGMWIATYAISHFSWQWAFYIPALISLITSVLLFAFLRDKPSSLGLPDVEEYKGVDDEQYKENNKVAEDSVKIEHEHIKPEEEKLSYAQLIVKHILLNPVVWLLVAAYIFVYIVRIATEDWLFKYLTEYKNDVVKMATAKLSSLSVMGAVGTVLAGFVSDKFFRGRRTPVNIIFLFGLLVSLLGFAKNPAEYGYLDYVYTALIGAFSAGLHNLIGLYVVEVCSKKVASAANGFAGMISYFGASLSSIVTGLIIDKYGWDSVLLFWIISTVIAILLIFAVIPCERIMNRKRVG